MYEDQYYIVDKVFSDDTLYLKATKTTAKRKYGYKKLEYGEAPLFFENVYKDRDIKLGKVRAIKSAHMNITHLIVDDDIKEKIDKFDISNFQFYPAVIIDDGDTGFLRIGVVIGQLLRFRIGAAPRHNGHRVSHRAMAFGECSTGGNGQSRGGQHHFGEFHFLLPNRRPDFDIDDSQPRDRL